MLLRYLFTGYNLKDAEQTDVTEIVVYASNEGEALKKASQCAIREHYKPETVEEMPSIDEDETPTHPLECQGCDAFQACISIPDKCDGRGNHKAGDAEAEVSAPGGDES